MRLLCVFDTIRVDDIDAGRKARRRFSIRAITFYFTLGQVNGVKGKVTLVTSCTISKRYLVRGGEMTGAIGHDGSWRTMP